MNWRQIERWATIAIYISAGVGLAMLMVEELSPPGSLAARLGETVGGYLTRLGEIGGGVLFAIVLAYLTIIGATWLMVLLMEGIDRLRSRRARSQLRMQQIREEAREKFRAEIREEVRQDVDDIVRERLAELGIASDTFLDLRRTAAEPRPANSAPLAGHGSAALTEEGVRRIVLELMQQMGVNPGIAVRPERQDAAAEPRPVGLTEEDIRSVVRECVRQLGIKPGQAPTMPADG